MYVFVMIFCVWCNAFSTQLFVDLQHQCRTSRRFAAFLKYLPLEQANRSGATPLTLAIKAGSIQCLELLLELKADPNAGCRRLWDPSTNVPTTDSDQPQNANANDNVNLTPVGVLTKIPQPILQSLRSDEKLVLDLPPLLMALTGPGHIAVVRRLLEAKVGHGHRNK